MRCTIFRILPIEQIPQVMNEMWADFEKFGLYDCPACGFNIEEIICHFHCDPRQSDFVNLVEVKDETNSDGKKQISSLEYHISAEFANGVLDSCRNLRGGEVVTAFCGPDCDAQTYFDKVEERLEKKHDLLDFEVKISAEEEVEAANGKKMKPLPEKPIKCSEPVEFRDQPACTCDHCKEVC